MGAKVRLRNIAANTLVSGGHTRLPTYAAGAHGAHPSCTTAAMSYRTAAAHRLGDAAEPLYAVAFKASDLWPHPERAGDEVVLDLWQSYLEAAE